MNYFKLNDFSSRSVLSWEQEVLQNSTSATEVKHHAQEKLGELHADEKALNLFRDIIFFSTSNPQLKQTVLVNPPNAASSFRFIDYIPVFLYTFVNAVYFLFCLVSLFTG